MNSRALLPMLLLVGCAHVLPGAREGRVYELPEGVLKAKLIAYFHEQKIELAPSPHDPHVLVSKRKETTSGTISGLSGERESTMGASVALDSMHRNEIDHRLEEERTLQLDEQRRDSLREFQAELEDAPRRAFETANVGLDWYFRVTTTHEGVWGKDRALLSERSQWKVELVPLGPTRTLVRVYKASTQNWDHSADQSYFIGTNAQQTRTTSQTGPTVIDRDLRLEARLAEYLDFSAAVEVLGEATLEHDVPAAVPPPKATPTDAEATAAEPAGPADSATPASAAFAGVPCEVDTHGVRLEAGRVVLLSDLLGTREAATAVAGVACQALAKGVPLTLALSLPGNEQARLNVFLASDGGPAARDALVAGPFWQRVWQDGRSSEAIAALLEQVRAWRAAGGDVAVLAVDLDVPGNPRAAYISSRLLAHHRTHPQRLMVGLLGNAHTSLKPGPDWAPDLLPAGYRLQAAGVEVESYDVAFIEGTQWTCHVYSQGRLRCGSFAVKPGPKQHEARASLTTRPYLSRFEFRSKEGFDGLLFVGKVSASRPVLAASGDHGEQKDGPIESRP